MTDIDPVQQRLAQIRERSEKATPGPWMRRPPGGSVIRAQGSPDHDEYVAQVSGLEWQRNAEFIAHARTDLDDLLAVVQDVLAIHVPSEPIEGARRVVGPRGGTRVERYMYRVCVGEVAPDEYPEDWPCPTVRAITNRLGGAS